MDLYQQPGIAEHRQLRSHQASLLHDAHEINPTRIVPIGPLLDLTKPHGREKLD